MVQGSLKKLIDEYIETVKHDDTYYTYCSKWDNPENESIAFPNDRVGIGKTKQEAFDNFMKHEAKRQALLAKCKGDIETLKEKVAE